MTLVGELARTLGRATRALRAERGWSQEFLAERISLDQTYISKLERGQRNPALSTIERLAEALEVEPSQLFSEHDDRSRRLTESHSPLELEVADRPDPQ